MLSGNTLSIVLAARNCAVLNTLFAGFLSLTGQAALMTTRLSMWRVPLSRRKNLSISDLLQYIYAPLQYCSSIPTPGLENWFVRNGGTRAIMANPDTFPAPLSVGWH